MICIMRSNDLKQFAGNIIAFEQYNEEALPGYYMSKEKNGVQFGIVSKEKHFVDCRYGYKVHRFIVLKGQFDGGYFMFGHYKLNARFAIPEEVNNLKKEFDAGKKICWEKLNWVKLISKAKMHFANEILFTFATHDPSSPLNYLPKDIVKIILSESVQIPLKNNT